MRSCDPKLTLRRLTACCALSALLSSTPVWAQSSSTENEELKTRKRSGVSLNLVRPVNPSVEFDGRRMGLSEEDVRSEASLSFPGQSSGIVPGASDFEHNTSTSVNFIRVTDDIQENGIPGAVVVVSNGPNNEPQYTTLTDFGDLHTFNVAFDRMGVSTYSGSFGLDIVNVVWLDKDGAQADDIDTVVGLPTTTQLGSLDIQSGVFSARSPRLALANSDVYVPPPRNWASTTFGRRPDGIGFIYGVKLYEQQDTFSWYTSGGILGPSHQETTAENEMIGPQWGWVTAKSFGPLTARFQSVSFVYFNSGHVRQRGGLGEELVPGATNRLLYGHPTYFDRGETHNEMAPGGELRAELQLQLTETISLRAAWSSIVFNSVLFAADRIEYRLPDLGLRDPGREAGVASNLFCGIQFVR
jgi:hypothetical protein